MGEDQGRPGPTIGERLASERRARGLTQVTLAPRFGRHESVVSRWETGTLAMTAADLVDVATVLGLDVGAVLWDCRVPGDVRARSSHARPARERTRFGRRLAAARTRAGIGPAALWRATDISPCRPGVIERGADATLDEVEKLAGALPTSLRETWVARYGIAVEAGPVCRATLGPPESPPANRSNRRNAIGRTLRRPCCHRRVTWHQTAESVRTPTDVVLERWLRARVLDSSGTDRMAAAPEPVDGEGAAPRDARRCRAAAPPSVRTAALAADG